MIILLTVIIQTFKQSLLNIMKNSSIAEFQMIVVLLDELLRENRLNILLKAWSSIKQHNKNNRKLFSNSSFAKTLPRIDLPEVQIKQVITNRPRHNTTGNDKIKKQENKSIYLNNCSFSQPKQDNHFQDMILQRLKLMQSKLQYVQLKSFSRKRYSQHGYYTERKCQDNLLKFKLNPRYIPIRKKLDTMQTMIQETNIEPVVDQTSQKSSQQSLPVIQTPKIGAIDEKQVKYFIFPQVMDAFNFNNQTQGTQSIQDTYVYKNQTLKQQHSEVDSQYHSDRFPQKKIKKEQKIKKISNSSRMKVKKQDKITNCENNPRSNHPNINVSKRKENEQRKLQIFPKKQPQSKNNKLFI